MTEYNAEVSTFDPNTGQDVIDDDNADALLAVAQSTLISFACAIKENYKPSRHHYIIANELTKLLTGETKRLMIFSPPQSGKSELATQLFPAFFFGHFPEQSLIVGAYAQDKADDFGRATKSYMESEQYKAVFANTRISSISESIRRFQTTGGGHYYAVGIGAGVTGRGANGLVLDDPYKNREEADSENRTTLITDWWKSTFRTRLRGDGWICIIQTRWTKRDLVQFLIDNNSEKEKYQWRIVNLVAVIEDEKDEAQDPLGRHIGEVLWPDVFDAEVMEQIKHDVGARDWNALYQQRPSDAKGEIFLRDNWKFWCYPTCNASHQHHYLPDHFDDGMHVWDTSFKDLDHSDYVVGLAGGRKGPNLYVLGRSKARANVLKTCMMVERQLADFPQFTRVGVEDKANGPAVISTMQQRVPGVIELKAEGTKQGRWQAAAPAQESGNVFLPYGVEWTDDFIEVCASVPHGKYDDDADAISYLILHLIGQRLTGMLDWMKELVEKARSRYAA